MMLCGRRAHRLCKFQSYLNDEDSHRRATASSMHALRHRQPPTGVSLQLAPIWA